MAAGFAATPQSAAALASIFLGEVLALGLIAADRYRGWRPQEHNPHSGSVDTRALPVRRTFAAYAVEVNGKKLTFT
jgi:hypothetical protein